MRLRSRLIVHDRAPGAWNMAVDESLLESYVEADPPVEGITLRLYGWSPAALSLGRAQTAPGDERSLKRESVELVRRPTGGAAVLHDHERTYAIVGRLRRPPFPDGVLPTYRRIAEALAGALRSLGVDARAAGPPPGVRPGGPAGLCFGDVAQHEITHGSSKLVGSAQLRRRGAFLQHGSILLSADPLRSARMAGVPPPPAGRIGGVETVLGRPVDPPEIDRALVASFERSLDVELVPGALTAKECHRAEELERLKYRSRGWTIAGRASTA